MTLLHAGQFSWQGEAWPGQQLQWRVAGRDKDREAGQDANQDSHWQTSLRLDLPTLGQVAAAIRIQGGRVQLTLRASEEETVTLMQNQEGKLARALGGAELTLSAVAIHREE